MEARSTLDYTKMMVTMALRDANLMHLSKKICITDHTGEIGFAPFNEINLKINKSILKTFLFLNIITRAAAYLWLAMISMEMVIQHQRRLIIMLIHSRYNTIPFPWCSESSSG